MPKLKGGSRAEHEVAPNASQIVSSRRPRNDLPIEEVRFAADSLLEGGGFEPSVPREEKAHLRCPKRNSAPRGDAHRRRRPSRDFFLKRSGPVSPGSDIAAAYRNGERRLIPNGSDTLAERR
jgi:hypothetical protein